MTLRIHTPSGPLETASPPGTLLTEAAQAAGLILNTRCAGNGVCGGCAVKLGPGHYRVNNRDVIIPPGGYETALACRTTLLGDTAEVAFPRTSVLERDAVIDDDFSAAHLALRRAGTSHEPATEGLGLAVDIGTTTVAVLLVDLSNGRHLAKASMYNQQIRKADDVASRISFGRDADHVRILQRLLIEDTLNPLVAEVCAASERPPRDIIRVVVSGNTVMSHLCFGLSPESIGVLPFTPLVREYPPASADTLGLSVSPDAVVQAVPSIAGYVGGDIVSDIYLTGMHEPCAASVLIDVGTNGEMVFRDGDRFAACATAAGPAFEGYGLAHGCRAARGAIDRILFDASLDIRFRVIGGTRPTGLCGSAVIDFLACGLRSGLINHMGRYDEVRLRQTGRYMKDAARCGESLACIVADSDASSSHGPIVVTEHDIAQVLKAKAAIYAGLTTMLETLHWRVQDVQRCYLAGGFARHISLDNAILIGLFPDIPLERYEIIGNGSLAGAVLALTQEEAMPAYTRLIDQPRVIELNTVPSFESHFIDALALPHLEPALFPGHARRLTTACLPT